jgi:hypothetical protein
MLSMPLNLAEGFEEKRLVEVLSVLWKKVGCMVMKSYRSDWFYLAVVYIFSPWVLLMMIVSCFSGWCSISLTFFVVFCSEDGLGYFFISMG